MNIFTSTAVKKSAILIGLLFFIHLHANAQGCNCPPIASCTPCQGGLTSLTLRYNGALALSMTISDGSAALYSGLLVPNGAIITVTGSLPNNTFSGSQLSAVVTLILNFNTLTNCAAGISVGQTLGSFTVLAAESLLGGTLCCDAGDLETVDPVLSGCPGDIVVPSNALDCFADVSWLPPTAVDNCGAVTLTSTHNPGDTFSVGTTAVTYTATDDYGNTSLCSFDVTVNDETDPVIAGCLSDITVSADALCEANVSWIEPTATDNCGALTFVSSHPPGTTFPLGTTPVLYTATDTEGNVSTCTFDVIVNDDTDPVITGCPVADILAVANGSCEAVVSWVAPAATDNCGLTFISSHDPGDTFPLGTTSVVYTATDPTGNISTCTFDVIVNDDADPVISGCPSSDIVAIANASCQAIVSWTAPTASDNCGVTFWDSSHDPGDTFNKGTTLVTYTATDAAGNSAVCTFNVIVNDETDPIISGCIASDIVVTANVACLATVSWSAPFASDNCGPFTFSSNFDPGDVFSLGTTQVIYTATDGSGNISTCEFNVIVQDDTDPVISGCPASDIITSADAGCQASVSWTAPTATDNCLLANFTSTHDPGDIFPLGTTVVLYTATDGSGNISTCSFNVVVNDDTDPAIAGCIASDIIVVANSSCEAVASWTPPTVTDNCGPIAFSSAHDPGDTFFLGTTIVTYTATDGFGNVSTCTFNVIVEDQTPPVLSGCVSSDIVVTADASCQALALWSLPTATDNCGATITSTHDPGDIFSLGTTVVTYTATDAAGNTATCDFNVIVQDDTDPIFVGCIATDIVVFADASCQASATWTPPVASDNCGAVAVNPSHLPGSTFLFGTTQVTYTATDGTGNNATCTFNVIVQDNTGPVFSGCISSDVIGVADASCEAIVSWTPPTATDNCDAVIILTSSHDPGETFSLGTTMVTYTATDGSGNVSTCTFNVIINDNTNPVFSGCNTADIVATANAACEAIVSWTAPTATDNCAVTLTSSHDPGETFSLGTTTVTYTAADGSGNIAVCSFNVIVVDQTDPVIAGCPGSDIIVNADATCLATANWTAPTATDNCGGVTWTNSHSPGDIFPKGTTQVVYTATDGSNNTATCTFNVIVTDMISPLIAGCMTSDVIAVANSGCQSAVSWVEPTATDNCGMATITSSHSPGDIFPLGRTTVTYTATDESGNSATCSFDVDVRDDIDPVITGCQDVIAVSNQSCEAIVNWTAPTASDCSTVLVVSSHNSGDLFPMGSTLVTYTATDSYGNTSSCSFNVKVEDKTPPSIQNCVNDIVVNADSECDATVQWMQPTAVDNCGTVALIPTHVSGSAFPIGTTIVKYTATDDAGNIAVCQFNVIVRNETPPQFADCPEDISVYSNEVGEAVAEWASPSAAANCGAVTLSSSHNSGDVFGIGVTEVEYKAEDITGNISYCRFSIEVIKQKIEIDISKVVTPDGNGVNDEWVVSNIERFGNNKVVIVDRWGSVIYSASGYNNENVVWRGVNRDGASVPTGTYFYTIFVRYGEDSFEKTGFIELIR